MVLWCVTTALASTSLASSVAPGLDAPGSIGHWWLDLVGGWWLVAGAVVLAVGLSLFTSLALVLGLMLALDLCLLVLTLLDCSLATSLALLPLAS